MADLSITVASVAGLPNQTGPTANAGTTITAGMSVYLDPSTGTWLKTLAAGTANQAGAGGRFGIALHAALTGQPLFVQESGLVTIGATVAVGTVYVVSANAGTIAPITDLVSTNKLTILGVAISTTQLDLSAKKYWGVSIP